MSISFYFANIYRTGKWVGSGMGAHALSQPAREYLCKIIELSLFAADFLLSHILLFALLPALCIPYVDKWHSVILFWLRPSRQIRPPIFSMKQNRLRKRIVRRYATLYFIIFVIFCALIVGPLVAGTIVLLWPLLTCQEIKFQLTLVGHFLTVGVSFNPITAIQIKLCRSILTHLYHRHRHPLRRIHIGKEWMHATDIVVSH